MELRQFTYVDMVATCGSFTKAAAKLFISQPALSNYIGKIEEDLGVQLFDRSSTSLTLTYAGEQYLKHARVILGQMDEMDKKIRDITQNMKGKLRLGFPSERIIYMLPLILAPLKTKYPGIDVEVFTGPGNRLTEGRGDGFRISANLGSTKGYHSGRNLPGRAGTGNGKGLSSFRMYSGFGKEDHSMERNSKASIYYFKKRSCPSGKCGGFV